MRHRCFNCGYSLSHAERVELTPKTFQFTPPHFICPNCQEKLGSTELSRFVCVLALLFSLFATVIVISGFSLSKSFMPVVMMVFVLINLKINQYIIWPFIVNLKKWETLQASLPKSRLVGYSMFLVMPILIFIGLFWFGVK
jgi:hypothetical protein